jgi:type IV secretory pathway TrbD component
MIGIQVLLSLSLFLSFFFLFVVLFVLLYWMICFFFEIWTVLHSIAKDVNTKCFEVYHQQNKVNFK